MTRRDTDMAMDRAEQLVAREWLGQVLLGSHDAPARLVEQAILRTEHDHRRGAELGVVLDQRTGLIAVEPRHHDVDEDDRRPLIRDLGQRLESVDRGQYFATLLFQDRKSTRLNSSHHSISYAVFCLKIKTISLHDALPLRSLKQSVWNKRITPNA